MSSFKSITHQDLKDQLRQGPIKFYYRKLKGELRQALGTLNLAQIPNALLPKGNKVSDKHVAYYDLEKGAWRSVSMSQQVWID